MVQELKTQFHVVLNYIVRIKHFQTFFKIIAKNNQFFKLVILFNLFSDEIRRKGVSLQRNMI